MVGSTLFLKHKKLTLKKGIERNEHKTKQKRTIAQNVTFFHLKANYKTNKKDQKRDQCTTDNRKSEFVTLIFLYDNVQYSVADPNYFDSDPDPTVHAPKVANKQIF